MKAEIAELVKQTSSHLTYAITVSGAVVAWLFTQDEAQSVIAQARWLPIVCSAMFGLLAGVSYLRIREKSGYIHDLEERFAAQGLGWEHTLRSKPARIFWLQTASWGLLNFCNLVVALGLEFPASG